MTDEPTISNDALRAVLAGVAIDEKAPAHARVSAARTLMRGQTKPAKAADQGAIAGAELDHPAVAWLEQRRARRKDSIPCKGSHRGVGLHDHQSSKRLAVVRKAIDAVLALHSLSKLLAVLESPEQPPEARLLAWACLETAWDGAAASRSRRPTMDMAYVRAAAAGLDSQYWRSPWAYGSLLEIRTGPDGKRLVKREKVLELA